MGMKKKKAANIVYANQDESIVLGLHAHFDAAFEKRLVRRLRAAKRSGLSAGYLDDNQRPHMTMGSWTRKGINPQLLERFKKGLKDLPICPLELSLYLHYGKQYYLSFLPLPTPDLLAYHRKVNKQIVRVGRRFRQCDIPGRWEPHSALIWFSRKSLIGKHLDIMKEFQGPISTSITNFSVVCYGDRPAQTVLTVDL